MIDLPTTAVYLTDAQMAEFIVFQQNYDAISTLIAGGVFTIKNGKAILNFDKIGRVADIELQYHTYRMPRPQAY